MTKQILSIVLILAPLVLWGEQVGTLPDPVPPFLVGGGKRLPAQFKDTSFVTDKGPIPLYSLAFGNKRIGIKDSKEFEKRQDNAVCIYVDNHEVLTFVFWGGQGENSGYPFKSKEGTVPQLKADAKGKTITYSKEYPVAQGKSPHAVSGTFNFTLKALDDGRVELSWNCSGPDGVAPWLHFVGDYRGYGIDFNGAAYKFPSLSKKKDEKYKLTPIGNGHAAKIGVANKNPLKGFTVEIPGGGTYALYEETSGVNSDFQCRFDYSRKGSMVIDLGLSSSVNAAAPPPVAGIDFWANDAVHVPVPASRNLMPNPSFEQGLRFWRWWQGGSLYQTVTTPVYSATNGGLYGNKALLITPYEGARIARSMPIAVENGKTYTVSFYAKSQTLTTIACGVSSACYGSQFTWEEAHKNYHQLESTNWERKSFTFTSDTRGITLELWAHDPVMIDGIQVEEGEKPTEFVAPPIEGLFVCSDPSYVVEAGKMINGKLQLSGKPGGKGTVSLSVRDFYRREVNKLKLDYALDSKGTAVLNLPYDTTPLGKGLFIIRADFQPVGGDVRTDYYRLSIIKSLKNTHPTSQFFGNNLDHNNTKGEDLSQLFVRWGWGGGTSYGLREDEAKFLDKYRIVYGPALMTYNFAGFGHIADDVLADNFQKICYGDDTSKTNLQFVEDTTYNTVLANPWCKSWALSTEIEGESKLTRAHKYDEFAKIQTAFWKGVKRANPAALVYPDGGTSGFSDDRGLVDITGYLASTQGKVKWDVVAVHPYGDLDGVKGAYYGAYDLDVEIAKLVAVMKKYGYGPETPINIDECFDLTPTHLPEWGDDGCFDHYSAGFASYDAGWQEYIQASWMARTYLILMKYWPQLCRVNVWSGAVYVDQYLTPSYACMVPNTLGNLFPNPKFKADIRPAAGIRGYAFEDVSGSNCTVALWCNMDKVDDGFEKGPAIGVKFDEVTPEVIDLMGNSCRLPAAKNGVTPVQLSSAPLFLRVNKQQADKLVQALCKAEVADAGSSLRVSFKPALGGKVEAKLENLTGNPQNGKLLLKEGSVPFEVPPMGSITKEMPVKLNAAPGIIEPWAQTVGVELADGKKDSIPWDMSCFTIPYTAKPLPLNPDDKAWAAIPAIPVNNWLVKDSPNPPKHGYVGKLDAKFQLAWDKENLYLRVNCKNTKFIPLPKDKWDSKALYRNDSSVELYLDTIASGHANLTSGYDQNDYRYDFGPSSGSAVSGTGAVYRYHEVFIQLAGGMAMPTKDQAAKGVKCIYHRTGPSCSYVIVLPQLYIEPMRLEKGWRAGFCLFIHDKDDGETTITEKGVSISTRKGAGPSARPDFWPIMVLGE